MNKKLTTIKYCLWCGDPFEVKSPNQKYCPSEIKDCSKEAKRESWRKAADKYRRKYKDVLKISQVYKMGSGFLSGKPENDFKQEYQAIQKEKKRLKLNGLVVGMGLWMQFNCENLMKTILQRGSISLMESYPVIIVLIIILVGAAILGFYYK